MANISKKAKLHGRRIDLDQEAFLSFAESAYLAHQSPAHENQQIAKRKFKELVRANNKIALNRAE